ncbi:MAG: penicillin-binding protein 2 [Candidatus Shapirobacteria bacterium]|nr:penicillin-binding protein 2 [Candidatus Shapirobacteria bacterium]
MENQRLKILSSAFLFSFIIVLVRFFYWQIIKGPELKEKSLMQTYKLEKILPERGIIYSSDGFPLVLNQNIYILSIYKPNLKEDLGNLINKIDSVHKDFIKNNSNLISNFQSNPNQKWITFTTEFTSEEKDNLNILGISFEQKDKRFYPEADLTKDILGFMGKDDRGSVTGYGGLEAYYNKQLKGRTGFYWASKDATGKTILTKKGWQSEAVDGRDIYTTINRSVQYLAEKLLKEGIQKYSADSGSISIMEPSTGAIIAMTNFQASPSATFNHNSAILDLFEPGSIFKPIIVSMALDTKTINTSFICDQCYKPRVIGEYTISNWNNELNPNSTLQDIIKNSDNIGMSFVIDHLGLKNFLDYYNKLGLSQKTGIDLQGEARSAAKTYWPDIDLATASFGQGIAITQIQMLQAFNVLANNGYLIRPHLVNYFSEGDKIFKPKTKEETKIFDTTTIDDIKSILNYAAENGAVAKLIPKDLNVCTKSGTAQIALDGKYTDSATIASYIGFSPCNNPKFTMIVTINNPRTSPWGSSTAAPIWFNLASGINHLL